MEQEDISRVWSLIQLEAREWNVLSESLLQVDRFNFSMLEQFWEKLTRAESPTF